ncbi:MAG: hypothetical protein M1309_05960 [Actinobacteria bacterium]|nr:hypothetical protein [Actinomycetota bacterium]
MRDAGNAGPVSRNQVVVRKMVRQWFRNPAWWKSSQKVNAVEKGASQVSAAGPGELEENIINFENSRFLHYIESLIGPVRRGRVAARASALAYSFFMVLPAALVVAVAALSFPRRQPHGTAGDQCSGR